jgi:hypothetical protein
VFPVRDREDREEDERGTGSIYEGLVSAMVAVKYRLFRMMVTLSAIGAVMLAGGASTKGW